MQQSTVLGSQDAPPLRGAPAELLVLEPSRLLRKVIAEVCAQRGVAVAVAPEVGAALTRIGQKKPTAVLTAFELPGLPGVALIAALKSCPYHRAIPIGLLTARESMDEYPSIYQPDAVLQKRGDLVGALVRFLTSFGIGRDKSRSARSSAAGALRGKILLVEDAAFIHKLIAEFLRVAGAEVMVVENGVEAVAAALEQTFDLVLMDIEMPEMDGLEATRRIHAAGIDVPVVALSALDAERLPRDVAAIGFAGTLTKPVDRQTLIETCARFLAGSGAQPAAPHPAV